MPTVALRAIFDPFQVIVFESMSSTVGRAFFEALGVLHLGLQRPFVFIVLSCIGKASELRCDSARVCGSTGEK
jgi:hypothetical protein